MITLSLKNMLKQSGSLFDWYSLPTKSRRIFHCVGFTGIIHMTIRLMPYIQPLLLSNLEKDNDHQEGFSQVPLRGTLLWRHNRRDGVSNHQSSVYSGADQRKHRSSASLAFVRGIHRSPVNSPHKWPVTRKMFPFDDVIMRIIEKVAVTTATTKVIEIADDQLHGTYLKGWEVELRCLHRR